MPGENMPRWTRTWGIAMYTLAVPWLLLAIQQGEIASAPYWFWSIIIILWHLRLGHAAYRGEPWARWGCLVMFGVYLGFLFVYYLWPVWSAASPPLP